MNRALPAIAAILFVLWLAGQFVSRGVRPPAVPTQESEISVDATAEVRISARASREVETVRVAPPRAHAVVQQLTPVEELILAGEFETAMVKLQEILSGDPPPDVKAASMSELARLHMVRRDFQGARALFERLMREFPGHPSSGNAERAIEYMERYETFRASFKPIEGELR